LPFFWIFGWQQQQVAWIFGMSIDGPFPILVCNKVVIAATLVVDYDV